MQNQQQNNGPQQIHQEKQSICALIFKQKIECKICHKIFNKRSHLYRHNRQQHDEKITEFKCSQCLKVFKRQSHLKRHMISHTHEKQFCCGYDGCGMRFGYKHHLQRHIKIIHAQQAAYKCEHCQLGFRKKKVLGKHVKTCKLRPKSDKLQNKQKIKKKNTKILQDEFEKRQNNEEIFEEEEQQLRQNIKKQSKKIVYRCKHQNCYSVFFKLYALKRHIKSVHQKQKIKDKISQKDTLVIPSVNQ